MPYFLHYASGAVHIGSFPKLARFDLPFATAENACQAATILGAVDSDVYQVKDGQQRPAFQSPGLLLHLERSLAVWKSDYWFSEQCRQAALSLACHNFSFGDWQISYGAVGDDRGQGRTLLGKFTLGHNGKPHASHQLLDYVNRSGARLYRTFGRDFPAADAAWNALAPHQRPMPAEPRLLDQLLEALPLLEATLARAMTPPTVTVPVTLAFPELQQAKLAAVRHIYGASVGGDYERGNTATQATALRGDLTPREATLAAIVADSRCYSLERSELLALLEVHYGSATELALAAWRERCSPDYRRPQQHFPTVRHDASYVIAHAADATAERLGNFSHCRGFSEEVACSLAGLLEPPLAEVWSKEKSELCRLVWRSPQLAARLAADTGTVGTAAWKLARYGDIAARSATLPLSSGKSLLADCTPPHLASGIVPPVARFRIVDTDGTVTQTRLVPGNYVNCHGARLRRRFCADYAALGVNGDSLDWLCDLENEIQAAVKAVADTKPAETSAEALTRLTRPVATFLRSLGQSPPGGCHAAGCHGDLALTKRALAASAACPPELEQAAIALGCDCRVAGLYEGA